MKRAILFGLLALVGGFAGALAMRATVAGQETILVGSGEAIKFDATNIIAGPQDICTTSTGFVDLPGMSQAFNMNGVGGAVTFFQGKWFNNTGVGRIRIRHVVDTVPADEEVGVWTLQHGILPGPPAQINGSSGMNFFDDSLTPGPHVITIQWRSQFGQEICVARRTLIVLHR